MRHARHRKRCDLSLAATINGGTITDNGIIDIVGTSVIDNNAALTGGEVAIQGGQTLTLNGSASPTARSRTRQLTFTTVQDPSAVSNDFQPGGETLQIGNTGAVVGNYADANNNSVSASSMPTANTRRSAIR